MTIKRRGDNHEGPEKFLGRVKDAETGAADKPRDPLRRRRPAA